jgi:hypothetical protein
MEQWIPTGIGRETKHARVLSKDDEDKLWRSAVMGTKTPKALQNAAFYVMGKMFSLCGGAELRNVKISQLKRETNPNRYIYTENVAKNSNGTFKQLHIKNKVVPLFSSPEAGDRCILHQYFRRFSQMTSSWFGHLKKYQITQHHRGSLTFLWVNTLSPRS